MAAKHVNNMRLQNLVMQLRKISSHPYLFDWPSDPATGELVVDDNLVNASGKMLLLNRLLDALFQKGHRVLLFSQFTTMLDVIVSILKVDYVFPQLRIFCRRTGLRFTRAGRFVELMGQHLRSLVENRWTNLMVVKTIQTPASSFY